MDEVLRSDDRGNAQARGVRLSGPIRLLITARDMAAALNLVEIARAAARDSRFEIVVVAQEPAARQFSSAGMAVRTLMLAAARSADGDDAMRLRDAARQLLEEIKPDAVLAGLSTPFDAGLDEAVLAEAKVPSFLYQDFWGEQNLLLGRGADQLFVIDEQAAQRNLNRYGQPSVVVGSARHAAYGTLDILATRNRVRAAIEVRAGERVVGFFGQALHTLPGYERTVRQFLAAANALDPSTRLVLRPHPRENAEQRAQTASLFRASRLRVTPLSGGAVEEALTACDVVVSLFSICTFDTAYLNRFSDVPIAVPMSLLFDEEIATYCRQHGNYMDFSHHALGLVTPVYDVAALPVALAAALEPSSRQLAWQRAQQYLPDPAEAPRRVLDGIVTLVDSNRS